MATFELFEGCDFVIAGDIHKHQSFRYNNGKNVFAFSGSLFQIGFGETVGGHGYCLWDVESKSFDFKEIDIEYGLYKIVIESLDDAFSNNTQIVNL